MSTSSERALKRIQTYISILKFVTPLSQGFRCDCEHLISLASFSATTLSSISPSVANQFVVCLEDACNLMQHERYRQQVRIRLSIIKERLAQSLNAPVRIEILGNWASLDKPGQLK